MNFQKWSFYNEEIKRSISSSTDLVYELYVAILIDSDVFVFICVDSTETKEVKEAVAKKLLNNANNTIPMSQKSLESNGFSMTSDQLPDDVFAYKLGWDDLPRILGSETTKSEVSVKKRNVFPVLSVPFILRLQKLRPVK